MRLQVRHLMVQVLRVLLYTISSVIKRCRIAILQMSFITGVQGAINTLGRSRRVVLFILVALVILLYMWPSWLRLGYGHTQITALDMCIDAKLQALRPLLEDQDAVLAEKKSDPNHYKYLPFIGNGYIGTSTEGHALLYIRSGRTSVPVQYYPYTTVNIEGLPSQTSTVLDLYHGAVTRQHCFQLDKACVSINDQMFAHRSIPSMLIQEFRAYNPTDNPVMVELQRTGMFNWPQSQAETKSKDHDKRGLIKYTITTGMVPVPESDDQQFHVAVAAINPPESVSIKSGGTWKHHTIIYVKYSDPVSVPYKTSPSQQKTLADDVEKELLSSLDADINVIRKSHSTVWKKLWSSGFGISRSRASGSLNGDKINTTIYYMLSHMRSHLHEQTTSESQKNELAKLLHFPDRCYDGHHTLQNPKLWADVSSIENLHAMVRSWMITLEKQGCGSMLRAGADGVLQAMILSFGALKFSSDHLEFGTHPSDLHRDYFFRRINYGNNTHLNISVIVGEDNKASLYTSLDRNDRPYYACDAGCLDPPVKLSNEWSQFPVKLTDPVTSILYITSDRIHMEDLKHAIHLKKIVEAPPHEHSVIAQHRHGHSYGGLPMLFWVSIGFLIIIFHLFLFKLIFNEYCNFGSEKYYSNRSRYSV